MKSCLNHFLENSSIFLLSKYANFIRISLIFLQLTVEITRKLKLESKQNACSKVFQFFPHQAVTFFFAGGRGGGERVEKSFSKIPKTIRQTFILAHILKNISQFNLFNSYIFYKSALSFTFSVFPTFKDFISFQFTFISASPCISEHLSLLGLESVKLHVSKNFSKDLFFETLHAARPSRKEIT